MARLTTVGLPEIETIYENLRKFLVKGQFIAGCDPDLDLFLKEKTPSQVEEIKRLADMLKCTVKLVANPRM